MIILVYYINYEESFSGVLYMPLKISDNKRIIALIIIFLIITLASGLGATIILYQTAFETTEQNLTDIARLESSIIESLHRSKGPHNHQHFLEDDQDVIVQIMDEIEQYKQANEAVEIEVAILEGNNISFLLSHHRSQTNRV
jgi:hypothetical protein